MGNNDNELVLSKMLLSRIIGCSEELSVRISNAYSNEKETCVHDSGHIKDTSLP